jgi:cysteinyl-tRNA synthetase
LQGSNAGTVAFGSNVSTSDPSAPNSSSGAHSSTPGSLDEVVLQTSTAFGAALDERDAERAVRAALDLESAIKDWSADTLQGDSIDRARGALRSMISRLGDAAVQGVQDPRSVVGPYIEAMLTVRATVRAEKRYDLSDVIRDAFVALNVEVRDTPQGVEWSLPE